MFPLNAAVPRTHRANRLGIMLLAIAIVTVLGLGVWAYTVKIRSTKMQRAEQASTATDAEPATDSFDKLFTGGAPANTGGVSSALTDGMKSAAGVVNKGITSQMSGPGQQPPAPGQQPALQQNLQANTNGWSALQQQQGQPLYVAARQPTAAERAMNEEKAARESPMIKQDAPGAAPPAASPVLPAFTYAAGQLQPKEQFAPAGITEYERQNLVGQKLLFAGPSDKSTPIVVGESLQTAPCIVRAGWDIPAIMEQAINSSVPGNIRARVRENVYDTDHGTCLVIPQGATLTGSFNSQLTYAQNRLQVKWTRLARQDMPTIFLDDMGGLSADGSAGLAGHVDNHMRRIVGLAALSSVFAAGIQISQNRGTQSTLAYPGYGQVAGAAAGQQLGSFGERITERNMNIPPTFTAPAGYRFDVRVDRDIYFAEPYRDR